MKILWIEYACLWLVAALLYLILPQGELVGEVQTSYVFEYVCIALTLVSIYLALRLFNFKWIRNRIQQGGEKAFIRYARMRIHLLELPLCWAVITYCYTLNSIGAFCVLIILLASFFITPSDKERNALLEDIEPKK